MARVLNNNYYYNVIFLLAVLNHNAVAPSEGKVYDPCVLAQEMVEKYRFPQSDVADWICLIRHESEYNTSALGTRNADGSKDHGLFQISDKYWCVEGRVDGACGLDCKSLRDDDIKDDSVCARRIFRVTKQSTGNGFNAWAAWTQSCKNQDVQSYLSHCKTIKAADAEDTHGQTGGDQQGGPIRTSSSRRFRS